jgi:8-oxo-dGTP diphosphatase
MEPVTGNQLREVISGLVSAVRPLDDHEAADQASILAWIASGDPIFRTAPPATPARHLVSYFPVIDPGRRLVLLGDHVKSGLWLPSGGHVEDGEDPRDTVSREAAEELSIRARFHDRLGAGLPFFLTLTPTAGQPLDPDPREYRGVRWFPLDRPADWPADQFDPQMGRFARKVSACLPRGDDPAS